MNSRAQSALAALFLAVAGLTLGGLAAEGVLRLYAGFGSEVGRELAAYDPMKVLIEPLGPLAYRHRAHAVQRYYNGTVATSNSLGFRGPEISRTKPAGVMRIVLVGGSTTHGWFVNDDETIAAHLSHRLSAFAPTRRFEVVNAALDGYDSFAILERLRLDVLPLRPDIVIVNSGVNDVRNARYRNITDGDSRTLLWGKVLERLRTEQRDGPTFWTRAKHHSLLLRLPGFLRLYAWRAAGPGAAATASKPQGRVDSGVVEVVPYTPDAADYFERNLRKMIAAAVAHDVQLIFSTPPSSIRGGSDAATRSYRNYWIGDAATTQSYRDTLASRMRRLADSASAAGTEIPYLRPTVPSEDFLDDAHLTSEGNRLVAEAFAAVILRLRAR